MGWLKETFTSSIGRKLIMSITGLFLIGFLLTHLSGNLLLFIQDQGVAFNEYSKFMSTSPIIRVLEVVLVAGFLFHIVDGIMLSIKNKKSRPVGYKKRSGSESSFFSKFMPQTGLFIFIYLIIHINSFTIKHRVVEPGNLDFYGTVSDAFRYGWGGFYWAFYVLAMVLLAFHLNHGFQSAFQSLGLNHKKYSPIIKTLGSLYSIVVPAAFAAIPVYFRFFYTA
ncbi:MAG: succinate dehydrogenase cytochrome b subunit [Leptospiraceae bacterium]|nr:succinate dehydrogenase cytochrome b subunit [Leptospiraceae bacterium]MCB1200309.1 succinate dehydrogenase cytochrome b subunit [Leptospiraceae bacterium]